MNRESLNFKINYFLTLMLLFLSLSTLVFIYYSNKLNNKIDYTTKISTISKLSNFSYSNNIYESRIKEQDDFSNKIHFINLQINYLDFIYEK